MLNAHYGSLDSCSFFLSFRSVVFKSLYLQYSISIFHYSHESSSCREELQKQQSHECHMKLQEQGKTEKAKNDLGETLPLFFIPFIWLVFYLDLVIFDSSYSNSAYANAPRKTIC